ncbi:MAG: sterol desaturase family protein [Legionellales bacterium]|nr:sterol desaturase family protein [Legionellales bacterium]
MKTMLKIYFSHPTIWGLWFLFAVLCGLNWHLHLFTHHSLWLILPVILAPFYEWFAHKYLLHAKLPQNDGLLKRFLLRLHHDHHRDPKNIRLLFAPVSALIILFIKLYLFYALLSLSFHIALIPLTSTVLYYLYYEWVHLGHHIVEYQHLTRYGKKMKSAHMRHHYINENYWWGITNHLGDVIFGTFKDRKNVEKSDFTKKIHHKLN